MSVILTIFWGRGQASADAIAHLRQVLKSTSELTEALIFTPAKAQDIYTDDGESPPLGLQLDFTSIAGLEAAAKGPLQALFTPAMGDLAEPEAQAFLRRTYPVDAPEHAEGARPCSFVVHYPGPAQDPNAWHDYYIQGHPPLMRRMPGIRGIEIMTPVEWVNSLPATKVHHLQRNRVLFDSPEALTAALQSPIRHELRADFDHLPSFEGGNRHYAMLTETYHP